MGKSPLCQAPKPLEQALTALRCFDRLLKLKWGALGLSADVAVPWHTTFLLTWPRVVIITIISDDLETHTKGYLSVGEKIGFRSRSNLLLYDIHQKAKTR